MVYALGSERYIASLDGIRPRELYIWTYLKQLLYHVLIVGIWDIDDLLSLVMNILNPRPVLSRLPLEIFSSLSFFLIIYVWLLGKRRKIIPFCGIYRIFLSGPCFVVKLWFFFFFFFSMIVICTKYSEIVE